MSIIKQNEFILIRLFIYCSWKYKI